MQKPGKRLIQRGKAVGLLTLATLLLGAIAFLFVSVPKRLGFDDGTNLDDSRLFFAFEMLVLAAALVAAAADTWKKFK